MRATLYAAVRGSASMVLLVTRLEMNFASYILERCRIRIIAERPGSHRQVTSFRRREEVFLIKTPDLVIPNLDAPRSFTLIDINIVLVDPAASPPSLL